LEELVGGGVEGVLIDTTDVSGHRGTDQRTGLNLELEVF
jgi:hypothetical protein